MAHNLHYSQTPPTFKTFDTSNLSKRFLISSSWDGVIFGVLIFMKYQRRSSELIFMDLNFMIATQSRGVALHNLWCNWYTHSISLSIFFVTAKRLGQIAWDRRILVSKTPLIAGRQRLLLLANTENSWLRYHDVLATPIIYNDMDSIAPFTHTDPD